MKVYIERSREEKELFASNVSELLDKLDLVAEEVLVVQNGRLVTEDTVLNENDEIKILSVISGG